METLGEQQKKIEDLLSRNLKNKEASEDGGEVKKLGEKFDKMQSYACSKAKLLHKDFLQATNNLRREVGGLKSKAVVIHPTIPRATHST